jgi:hypothetical protein
MKSIIVIKLFLVLCCSSTDNGQYRYEVKNLEDTTQTGVVYTGTRYSEGDTIRVFTN